MLDHRLVSLRNTKILAIFRVQAAILKAFAEHLRGVERDCAAELAAIIHPTRRKSSKRMPLTDRAS